jgi:hypothetical protein
MSHVIMLLAATCLYVMRTIVYLYKAFKADARVTLQPSFCKHFFYLYTDVQCSVQYTDIPTVAIQDELLSCKHLTIHKHPRYKL